MYSLNDIVSFDGDLYEVERVKEDCILVSSSQRLPFEIELEYVTLVCRAANRLDITKKRLEK